MGRGLSRIVKNPSVARRLRQEVMRVRIHAYRAMSDNSSVFIGATLRGPVLCVGPGVVDARGSVLGYQPSPRGLDGHLYIEVRSADSRITIGSSTSINNGAVIIAERSSVTIGSRCLVGPDLFLVDSDFHPVDPEGRHSGSGECAPVTIGDNVFVGARVTITKGVTIGENSVIGAGSVVTSNIPADCVAAGNPCRVLVSLNGHGGDEDDDVGSLHG